MAGLYDSRNLNMRKLRRDILKGRLAPCFKGSEDMGGAVEECPICMLHYPALNRSRCCGQGICTECYAQVGSKYQAAALENIGACPFCKAQEYRADYVGQLSADELAKREAESREVAAAQERQRLGELERQAVREREVAEARRNSAEGAEVGASPGGEGGDSRPRPVGPPPSAARAGEVDGRGGPGIRAEFDMLASPEPGPRPLADDSEVSAVLMQYADFLPPELLSGELSSGGLGVEVEVEELMVHQAILASLRSEGGVGAGEGATDASLDPEMEAALAASSAEAEAALVPITAPASLIDVDPPGYPGVAPAVEPTYGREHAERREAAARTIQSRVREVQAARAAKEAVLGAGSNALPASAEPEAAQELPSSPPPPPPPPPPEPPSSPPEPPSLTAEEIDARLRAAMAAGDRQMQQDSDYADVRHCEAVEAERPVEPEDWRQEPAPLCNSGESDCSIADSAPRRRPELDVKISPEQLYHERYGDY